MHDQAAQRPIVVTGASGQLGQTIVQSFGERWPTVGLTRRELDVTRAADVQRAIGELRPRAIVNCVGLQRTSTRRRSSRKTRWP